MGRNKDDGDIGCILMIAFLPFVLFFFIIKAFINLCVNASKKASNKAKTTKKTVKTDDIDDLEFDEINDILEEDEGF